MNRGNTDGQHTLYSGVEAVGRLLTGSGTSVSPRPAVQEKQAIQGHFK